MKRLLGWLRNCFKEDEEYHTVDLRYMINYQTQSWDTVLENNTTEIEYLKRRGYVMVDRDTYKIKVAQWRHKTENMES